MNIENGFKPERIIMLRNMLQLSQVNFAKKIHISQGALSQIENGKSQISLETLRNISNELNVNCNWVVNGSGEIFQKGISEASKKEVKKIIVKVNGTNNPSIPLVSSSKQKQYLKKHDDPDFVKGLEMFRVPGYTKGDFRLFEISDEAMTPTIMLKEIVIAESIDDHTTIENGTVCIIVTAEGVLARRVNFYGKEKNVLILKGDQRKVKNLNIHFDKIKEIWLVKAKITSAFASTSLVDSRRIERLESSLDNLRKEVKKLIRT